MIRRLKVFWRCWRWALANRPWFGWAGAIIVLALMLSVPTHRQGYQPPTVGQSQHKQDGAAEKDPAKANQTASSKLGVSPPSRPKNPQTEKYDPDCQKPKDHDEADLCVQRRMANAAEDGTWYSRGQFWLGVFGLTFVVATLAATFIAAFSAWRTVGVMQDTAKKQLRAYVTVQAAHFGIDGPGLPFVQLLIANVGATPASRIRVFARLEIFQHPLPPGTSLPPVLVTQQPTFALHPKTHLNGPVRPDAGRIFFPADIVDIGNGNPRRLYVFGHAEYFDIYGDQHETPFGLSISGGPNVRNTLNGVPNLPARFETVSLNKDLT